MLQINQESSAALQWKRSCWFKSANRRRAWPRFSFQYPVWVGGFSYDPPLLNLRFGCTQYAISLCFIQRFEYLKVNFFFTHLRWQGQRYYTSDFKHLLGRGVGLLFFFFFLACLAISAERTLQSNFFLFLLLFSSPSGNHHLNLLRCSSIMSRPVRQVCPPNGVRQTALGRYRTVVARLRHIVFKEATVYAFHEKKKCRHECVLGFLRAHA